jgi:hypothetical protein
MNVPGLGSRALGLGFKHSRLRVQGLGFSV